MLFIAAAIRDPPVNTAARGQHFTPDLVEHQVRFPENSVSPANLHWAPKPPENKGNSSIERAPEGGRGGRPAPTLVRTSELLWMKEGEGTK